MSQTNRAIVHTEFGEASVLREVEREIVERNAVEPELALRAAAEAAKALWGFLDSMQN